MKEEKLVDLVRKIDAKTDSGELSWEKTVSDEEFQANLSNSLLRIRREYTGSTDPDFVLTVLDKNGTELESISDAYLNRFWRRDIVPDTAFAVMQRIFKAARRKALGVDKAIEGILSELGE